MSDNEHDNFVGCGKLYPEPPESPRDVSGEIKVSIVVPFDLPAGSVVEVDYKLHGFKKTTATGGRMFSLQAWGKSMKGDGTLKDKLWDLIQKHPEVDHWKVSEIRKKYLRTFKPLDITKAARELMDEGKLVPDYKGSRGDSCWFWTKEKAPLDPLDFPHGDFPISTRQWKETDFPIDDRQAGARTNPSGEGSVVGVSVGVSELSGVVDASPLVEGSGSFEKVGTGNVRRAKVTWRA